MGLGLVVQFGIHLTGFIRRRTAAAAAAARLTTDFTGVAR
jgi:hypothetical protein